VDFSSALEVLIRFQHECPNLAISRTGGEVARKKVLCFFLSRKKILLF
jgi:hypothetical protein